MIIAQKHTTDFSELQRKRISVHYFIFDSASVSTSSCSITLSGCSLTGMMTRLGRYVRKAFIISASVCAVTSFLALMRTVEVDRPRLQRSDRLQLDTASDDTFANLTSVEDNHYLTPWKAGLYDTRVLTLVTSQFDRYDTTESPRPFQFPATSSDQRYANSTHLAPKRGVQIFSNVCILPGSIVNANFKSFQAKLRVFHGNSSKALKSKNFRLSTVMSDRQAHWKVHFVSKALPSSYRLRNETAYFTPYWRDANRIFLLLHLALVSINRQIQSSLLLGTPNMETINPADPKVLVAPKVDVMCDSFQDTVKALGFRDIIKYSEANTADAPVCFRHAVFGQPKLGSYKSALRDVQMQVESAFNFTRQRCERYHVVVIARLGTRVILNIDKFRSVLRERGYSDVRVESFENQTVQEQIRIVRCASVLIGVQGAGLAWYMFMPRHALVVELTWYGWTSKYRVRIRSSRPDIDVHVMTCKAVTPEAVWVNYAKKWFKYTGEITNEMKKKLTTKSRHTNAILGTVYRDSNCVCSLKSLAKAVPHYDTMMSKLYPTLL